MATFRYLAKRGPQEVIEGVLEADTRANVLTHLAGLGYTPVQIREARTGGEAAPTWGRGARVGRIPVRQMNQFTRQFASLMRSQVPLMRSLGILKEQTSHPGLHTVLDAIREHVRQGQTLSQILAQYPRVFSPLYVSLVRSGEITGTLDTVLERLAMQADQEEALRAKVQMALAYPLFVGVVGLGTVVFLLTFVMPRLLKLFVSFGGTLPLPTRILLTITAWCHNGWLWGVVVGVMGLIALLVRSQGATSRLWLDRLVLRLPVVGVLIRQVELARFARSFGLLLSHGIPILQATEVAIPVVKNLVIRKALEPLPANLREGSSLAACVKTLTIATPYFVHTVAVGEEGGKAAEALLEIANYYEREIERLLQILAGLLEPAMILVVGGIVGFIVMAILLPIFEMSTLVR